MKKLLLILAIFGIFWSCSEEDVDDGLPVTLEVGADTLNFNTAASYKKITVTTKGTWEASVAEEAQDWCSVEVNNSLTSYLTIRLAENDEIEMRETKVTVSVPQVGSKVITVRQIGSAPAILLDVSTFENVSDEPGTLSVPIIANIPLEVTILDTTWIRYVSSRAPQLDTLHFILKANLTTEKRSTEITLKQQNGDFTKVIPVEQVGHAEEYVPADAIKVDGDIKLSVVNGRPSSEQPGSGDFKNSYDGDYSTIWHSAWNNKGENYFPITIEYDFQYADHMDYLIYYPRREGKNGLFKEVTIEYKREGDADYKLLGDFDFKGSANPTKIEFPNGGIDNPVNVKFTIKSGAGDGQGFASCAEMEFYQKMAVDASLEAIFTDATYSELKEDVSYEQIVAIDNEFYKNIAKALYLGIYPSEFRVKVAQAYDDPDHIARVLKINPYSPLDNMTGIYVREGEDLVVFVGDTHGQNIFLRVMDFTKGYSGTTYPLFEGQNKLQMTTNGLVYIIYNYEGYEAMEPIKVHIATGSVNGYFRRNLHKDEDWERLLASAESTGSGFIDVVGDYAHVVFPVSDFRAYVDSPKEFIEAYDELVWLEHDLMGLHKYHRDLKNRMFFHSIDDKDSYMYATSYRTAYNKGTLSDIMPPDKFKTSGVWGPAHEVGHMHQTRPGLKWVGLTEVTNNIHSLHVQTTWGNRSRLINEDMGDGSNRFEKGFTSIIAGGIPHGEEGDVFCKLIPFYQLYMYSKWITPEQNNDFYEDLHEEIRVSPNPATNGACQLNFVKLCCKYMKLDLTDFFKAWGFLSPINKVIDDYGESTLAVTQAEIDAVVEEIANMNLPKAPAGMIYLHDDNYEMFMNPQPVVAGTASYNDNKVTVNGSEHAVAYELYQDNKLVKISGVTSFFAPVGTDWEKVVLKAVGADGTRVIVSFE